MAGRSLKGYSLLDCGRSCPLQGSWAISPVTVYALEQLQLRLPTGSLTTLFRLRGVGQGTHISSIFALRQKLLPAFLTPWHDFAVLRCSDVTKMKLRKSHHRSAILDIFCTTSHRRNEDFKLFYHVNFMGTSLYSLPS